MKDRRAHCWQQRAQRVGIQRAGDERTLADSTCANHHRDLSRVEAECRGGANLMDANGTTAQTDSAFMVSLWHLLPHRENVNTAKGYWIAIHGCGNRVRYLIG